MERAVLEVAQSRVIIEGDKTQLAAYEDALKKAEDLDASNQAVIVILKSEIDKLREAITDKQTALDAKQKEVDIYKAALAKETKKKNFFKTLAKVGAITSAVAIGYILLKQ